jgi:site-specific recombinase XerD
MKEKITFILMDTSDDNIGRLTKMIHQGSKVISRKSMKIKIPYKNWDVGRNRVKNNHPEADQINDLIEKIYTEFNKTQIKIPDGDDRQCVLEYIKRLNDKQKTDLIKPISTTLKYKTIISNFEYVIKNTFKMDTLPFGKLRDKDFINVLKFEIRKVRKKNGGLKKNKSWFNYMSVFGTYVNHWNTQSGTQFPINTKIFTYEIPDDEKELANILSRKEILILEQYEPKGYKKGESQLLAKNVFLFQYYTGGIRIQDTLTLTNKQLRTDGIEIKIKKSKRTQLFGYCYEQVECLKTYYPTQYKYAEEICKVKDLSISANTILYLNLIDDIGDIKEFTLKEFEEVRNLLYLKSRTQPDLSRFIEPYSKVITQLRDEISIHFFNEIRKLPQRFLFPTKLSWGNFKNIFGENSNEKMNERQAYLIHRVCVSHNSNLKRISQNLGFQVMGGHTPRHSISNHLLNDSKSISDIQNVLVHSDSRITKKYLRDRICDPKVLETLKNSNDIMREIREKEMRGF